MGWISYEFSALPVLISIGLSSQKVEKYFTIGQIRIFFLISGYGDTWAARMNMISQWITFSFFLAFTQLNHLLLFGFPPVLLPVFISSFLLVSRNSYPLCLSYSLFLMPTITVSLIFIKCYNPRLHLRNSPFMTSSFCFITYSHQNLLSYMVPQISTVKITNTKYSNTLFSWNSTDKHLIWFHTG